MPVLLLLIASNLFMTTAWYWHLKGGMDKPLLLVILISWGIALIEYCLAVPANRIGYAGGWSAGQLKIAQEAIALTIFGVFMVTVLGEPTASSSHHEGQRWVYFLSPGGMQFELVSYPDGKAWDRAHR